MLADEFPAIHCFRFLSTLLPLLEILWTTSISGLKHDRSLTVLLLAPSIVLLAESAARPRVHPTEPAECGNLPVLRLGACQAPGASEISKSHAWHWCRVQTGAGRGGLQANLGACVFATHALDRRTHKTRQSGPKNFHHRMRRTDTISPYVEYYPAKQSPVGQGLQVRSSVTASQAWPHRTVPMFWEASLHHASKGD
jgi:hypothetical protein